MIAIHYTPGNNFSPFWKSYCEKNGIPFKIVNCYDSDIISQLEDCEILLWHVNNFDYRDQIFAKYLIKSLEEKSIKVCPNYDMIWHFDDKIAQKYILESTGMNLVPTHVFYDKKTAMDWLDKTTFPKVFKLRRGSGSKNVRLVKSRREAKKYVRTAFGRGFSSISMWHMLQERYRKYRLGKENFTGLLKSIVRLVMGTPYTRMATKERGYIYFQDFIPGAKFDQRVIVIGNRAFAIKRMVRKNDFRASGSGHIIFSKNEIDTGCVTFAFDVSERLNFRCMTYDFIYDANGIPLLIEMSYGFNPGPYFDCEGYWDKDLVWHEEKVRPQEWMIEDLLAK